MKHLWKGVTALACALTLAGGASQAAGPPAKHKPEKRHSAFGKFEAPAADDVKATLKAWLNATGKGGPATSAQVEAIWATDRTLLDKVTSVLALGDPEAARLLREAREAPAPTKVPDVL